VSHCDPFPIWAYWFFAINIAVYQTMDNLDGKQARRTENSTALGELFDHGCDSLFLLFSLVPIANVIMLNPYEILLIMITGCFAFYSAHWEEYFTQQLILGKLANPTEIQWVFIFLFLFTSFIGTQWWLVMVEINGVFLKRGTLLILFASITIFFQY